MIGTFIFSIFFLLVLAEGMKALSGMTWLKAKVFILLKMGLLGDHSVSYFYLFLLFLWLMFYIGFQ